MPRTNAAETHGGASLRARVGGYVVDMVIFSAMTMIMVVIAGAQLLLVTHGATRNASDPTLYAFLAIIGLGTPLVWTVLNLTVLLTRHQTGGQYVAGVRVARADGGEPGARGMVAWWFCLNPVFFSWPMALVTFLPASWAISLLLQRATLAAMLTFVALCMVAPFVALVAAATDGRRRALHDRIAGMIVVPAE
ncbi:MAG TPA: RDD family protein [Dehalococcoidia bacterium]|nr:RDD family protein [Dehalococcoidia bacterium]